MYQRMPTEPQNHCLKFTDLKTNITWYGTANYTRSDAEALAHHMNEVTAVTNVRVVTIKEREMEQKK